MILISFSSLPLQAVTAAEKAALSDALCRNRSGIPLVTSSQIEDYFFALASACDTVIDDDFFFTAIAAAAGLGEANPQVPNTACHEKTKVVFASKVRPGPDLPGVSGVSVPIARRFDWAGDASEEPAATFLCAAVADEAGQVLTIAERILVNDEFSKALESIFDSVQFQELKNAIENRISDAGQVRGVDTLEKQLYVPIDADTDRYVVVTPLTSQLPGELDRRLHERKEKNEFFEELYFSVGTAGGVSSRLLGGRLPRLMCLPTQCQCPQYVRGTLPTAAKGRYLVVEFDAPKMNATGTDISAGFSLITTSALGFSDALRRQHPEIGGVESVAVGLSGAEFQGEFRDGEWIYIVDSGIKNFHGKPVRFVIPELKASARMHLVLRLKGELLQEHFSADSISRGMRFCGSDIFNLDVTVADEQVLVEIFQAWGGAVHMLADRAELLPAAGDKLDALLDLLAIKKGDGDTVTRNSEFVPIAIGYQGIEPPRPRYGVRGEKGQKHMFAMGITGLGEFVAADAARHDSIFWRWEYDRLRYSAVVRTYLAPTS